MTFALIEICSDAEFSFVNCYNNWQIFNFNKSLPETMKPFFYSTNQISTPLVFNEREWRQALAVAPLKSHFSLLSHLAVTLQFVSVFFHDAWHFSAASAAPKLLLEPQLSCLWLDQSQGHNDDPMKCNTCWVSATQHNSKCVAKVLWMRTALLRLPRLMRFRHRYRIITCLTSLFCLVKV